MEIESSPIRPATKRKMWPWVVVGLLVAGGAVAGAMVYQNANDFGQIQVKLNEPDAQVELKVDGKPLQLAADKTAKVRTGEHSLEVSGTDYKPETKPFHVKRGITEVIQIDLRSSVAQDPALLRAREVAKILAKANTLFEAEKPNLDEALAVVYQALEVDAESIDALEMRGRVQLAKGRLEAAREDFARVLKAEERRPYSFLGLGAIYYNQGNLDACIKYCTAALRISPKFIPAHQQRSLAYYRKGDTVKGIADATAVLNELPDHTLALEKRGLAYGSLGENQKALVDLDRYLKLHPQNAVMTLARSEINARLGNLDQALKDRALAFKLDRKLSFRVEPIIKDAVVALQAKLLASDQIKAGELAIRAREAFRNLNKPDVLKFASEALKLDPGNADANALVAWVMLEQGEERIKMLYHANLAVEADRRCALAYLVRSLTHSETDEAEHIVSDATVAIHLAPLESPAYARRATGFNHLLEYAQAKHDCQTAIVINSYEALAHFNLGYAEAMLGNYDKALESFNRYLGMKKDARGHLHRAGVYLKKNDIAKAKADMTMAEKIDTDVAEEGETVYPEPKRATPAIKLSEADRAKVNKLLDGAKASLETNDLEAVMNGIEEILKIDPSHTPARLLRVRVLLKENDQPRAIKECNQILSSDPESADAYLLRARAHKSLKSIADLTVALRLKPDYADAWELRGHYFYEQGDFAQARADYTMALKHQPERINSVLNRAYANAFLADYTHAMADMEAVAELGVRRLSKDEAADFHWVWAMFHERLGNRFEAATQRDLAVKVNRDIVNRELPPFPHPPGIIEEAPPPYREVWEEIPPPSPAKPAGESSSLRGNEAPRGLENSPGSL
ncbi:MAG: tetratricopeptide repeat protein [Planctomycetes bacterium]|nr:tetratricopeptide repeat protein [Planctomycetota bacterium]